MKILTAIGRQYYGNSKTVEPLFIEFTEPLRDLGHVVDHFDPLTTARRDGVAAAGEQFVRTVRDGAYDAVFFSTSFQAASDVGEYVREAGRFAPIIAWNSDDDWTWDIQTRALAPYFTFMFTTYRHIYEQNRAQYPNLRLSQWACYERYGDFARPKDLDFTFAGQLYGDRVASCRYLRKHAGLSVYGQMSGQVRFPAVLFGPGVRRITSHVPAIAGKTLTFDQVNDIWNRTKISYTPMEASTNSNVLQIKSRTFQMGLSGTLMLCRPSPLLHEFYEPGKEFVSFDSLEDCAEKARYYLTHETERSRIVRAYRDRTLAEHLWQHRFQQIFRSVGLSTDAQRPRTATPASS